LGTALGLCGFIQEALETYAAANKIDEKIGDYNTMAIHYMMSGTYLELIGDYEAAVAQTLKGLESAKKTDAQYAKSHCYARLVFEYAGLDKLELAEDYNRKLNSLFDDTPSLKTNSVAIELVKACKIVLLSYKGQWEEVAKLVASFTSPLNAPETGYFIRVLEKHGLTEQAKKKREEQTKAGNELKARFWHSKIYGYFLAPKELGFGEELNIRLDLINVGKTSAHLKSIKGLFYPNLNFSSIPSNLNLQGDLFETSDCELSPVQVKPLKFSFRPIKPGTYVLRPQVSYVDDVGENKTLELNPVTITVRPTIQTKIEGEILTSPVLPNRVPTGFADLDYLLLGGLPERYAVVLTSPSIDEKVLLVKKFLETGSNAGETTFYFAADAANGKTLAEQYPSNFYLFVCGPQAEDMAQASNVFKLKGVDNLTEIDIALTKALRMLNPNDKMQKRACIEVVSNVLLQHHAMVTRKWLSGILSTLKSKGFTTLAVLDNQMHPQEEAQAILSLFEGEVRISEKETQCGPEKILRIRKLYNQKYLERELILDKERLKS